MINKEKFNIYEDLNIKDFEDEDELLDEIIEKANSLRQGQTVDLVAKSHLTEFLLVELVKNDFNIGLINFDAMEYDYYGEYLLTVDSDKNIWICEAYVGDRPLDISSTYLYFYQEDISNQKIIDNNIGDCYSPTLFGFGEDENLEDGVLKL